MNCQHKLIKLISSILLILVSAEILTAATSAQEANTNQESSTTNIIQPTKTPTLILEKSNISNGSVSTINLENSVPSSPTTAPIVNNEKSTEAPAATDVFQEMPTEAAAATDVFQEAPTEAQAATDVFPEMPTATNINAIAFPDVPTETLAATEMLTEEPIEAPTATEMLTEEPIEAPTATEMLTEESTDVPSEGATTTPTMEVTNVPTEEISATPEDIYILQTEETSIDKQFICHSGSKINLDVAGGNYTVGASTVIIKNSGETITGASGKLFTCPSEAAAVQATPQPRAFFLNNDISNSTSSETCPSGSKITENSAGAFTAPAGTVLTQINNSESLTLTSSMNFDCDPLALVTNAQSKPVIVPLVKFTVDGATPAAGAVINTQPITFSWSLTNDSTQTGSTFYNFAVSINGDAQKTISGQTSKCDSTSCSFTSPGVTLAKGNYVWSVTGTQTDADGKTLTGGNVVNSAPLAFSVVDPVSKPGKPVLECPKGNYTTRNIGFYWTPSSDAENYTVYWTNEYGDKGTLTLSNNDASCQSNRCHIDGVMPKQANYSWGVEATNKQGSTRSDTMDFSITSNVSTPTAYSPSGTTTNSNFITFTWENVEDNVYEYHIVVADTYARNIVMDRYIPVSSIYCNNGYCSWTTDIFLPSGHYYWRVQAINNDSTSNWSNMLDFYVNCAYCGYSYSTYVNTVPTPSYPTGNITEATPTFSWRTLTGAAQYTLTIYDANGNVLNTSQTDNSVCNLESCTFSPNYTLPGSGKYTWKITGGNAVGQPWNSATASFVLQLAIPEISFVSPAENGTITMENPVVTWTDPGTTVTSFKVNLYDSKNNQLLNAELSRANAWCDGKICTIKFATIPEASGYYLTIQPTISNSTGKTSGLHFNVGVKPVGIELVSPKDNANAQSRPLFRWKMIDANDTKTVYSLTLTNSADPNKPIIFDKLVCGSNGLNCEDGEAYFVPNGDLDKGIYNWKVDTTDKASEIRTFQIVQ